MSTTSYPVTFPQRALLVESALHPENEAFDLPFLFKIEGGVDVARLAEAISAATRSSVGLLTTFERNPAGFTAHPGSGEFAVTIEETQLTGATADLHLSRLVAEDLARGRIRPEDPHQMRVTLVSSPDAVYMYMRASHFVGDAYSFYRWTGCISALYAGPVDRWPELLAAGSGHPGTMSPTPVVPEALEEYRELMRGVISFVHPELDVERPRGRVVGTTLRYTEHGRDAADIRESWAVREFGAATAFFAAYAVLLQRIGGHPAGGNTVVLGVPLANRHGAEAKQAVGYFVNTLPLPVTIDETTTWRSLCESVHHGIRLLQRNQGVDLGSPTGRGLCPASGAALDNAVTFYKTGMVLPLAGLTVRALPIDRKAITYPLTVSVADDGSSYEVAIGVAGSLIPTLPLQLFRRAVRALCARPDGLVVHEGALGGDGAANAVGRYEVLLTERSGHADRPTTIVDQVRASAGAHAGRVALSHRGPVTYEQLWERLGLFEEAITRHRGSADAFEISRTLAAYAGRLAELDDLAGARDVAAVCAEHLRECGLPRWATAIVERFTPSAPQSEEQRSGVPVPESGSATPLEELTAEELRIVGYVSDGLTNRHIATELNLSVRSIESRLTTLYRRLGVSTRTELAAWASTFAPR